MENLASWGSSTEFCCGDRGLSNIHIWSVQGLLESEAKQYIMLFLLESVQLNVFVFCFLFVCVLVHLYEQTFEAGYCSIPCVRWD